MQLKTITFQYKGDGVAHQLLVTNFLIYLFLFSMNECLVELLPNYGRKRVVKSA